MPTRRRCLTAGAAAGLAATCPPWLVPTVSMAAEAPPAPGLAFEKHARVRSLDEDGTLALSDGDRARLLAVRLPQLADLPKSTDAAERRRLAAHVMRSRTWLHDRISGRTLALWTTPIARDRHGRLLAQASLANAGPDDARWIQAALVSAGLARVATMPGAAAGAEPLLALEAEARAAGLGLWRDPLYQVRAPEQTWPWLGRFQIVRGIVRDAAKVRSRVYLNFGTDWRRDFTIMVERPRDAGLSVTDLLDLRRQLVQVRGWLFPMNGPMIALDHAAALETRVRL